MVSVAFAQHMQFRGSLAKEMRMRVVLNAGLVVVALTVMTSDANAWYCSAKGKNGASGWGFNFFQAEAEKTALAECRGNSKGQRCVIEYCW